MSVASREAILADVLELVNKLAEDWEYSGGISPDTFLFADLGFESIDAVVLASFIQERYQRQFPFPQLLAELGRRDVKDIRLAELVEFIHGHLNGGPPEAKS
jgi:acyl carrier protein